MSGLGDYGVATKRTYRAAVYDSDRETLTCPCGKIPTRTRWGVSVPGDRTDLATAESIPVVGFECRDDRCNRVVVAPAPIVGNVPAGSVEITVTLDGDDGDRRAYAPGPLVARVGVSE